MVLCALALGATPAAATPPEGAAGDWTYTVNPDELAFRTAGTNTFISGPQYSTLTGTFDGTSVDQFVVVCHQKAPDLVESFVTLATEFTGEVNGLVGTMTMKSVGKETSTTCNPSPAVWHGTWVSIGGTGGLADLHGHGQWWGPSFDVDYSGQIHVD
jgi:hypothetical protein